MEDFLRFISEIFLATFIIVFGLAILIGTFIGLRNMIKTEKRKREESKLEGIAFHDEEPLSLIEKPAELAVELKD